EPAAAAPGDAAGPDQLGLRPVPHLQRRADHDRRRHRRRPLARLRAHADRRPDPGRSRQPAHGRVARDQHRAPVHADLRVRQRHGGAGRRARRRIPRPRSAVRAEVPRLLPDRRGGGRPRAGERRVLGGALDRRARLHAPEVRAPGRHRVHLRAHDPPAPLASAGPIRRSVGMTPFHRRASAGGAPAPRRPAACTTPSGWSEHAAAQALAGRHRLPAWEPIPWLLALAFYLAFPKYLGFGTEVLVTILFALSLDLVLGYAGIVTLGHAAFFGAGAYTVGMLAKHGIWNEPITGLILAALAAALVGLGSGVVLLRTQGLTLLMLTLCTMALLEEAANLAHDYTGGFDGLDSLPIAPLLGRFEFNPLYPRTQYLYVLSVLFICFIFVRTLVYSPFGQSLTGVRENILRMHAVGAPVRRRLVLCYV